MSQAKKEIKINQINVSSELKWLSVDCLTLVRSNRVVDPIVTSSKTLHMLILKLYIR